LSLLSFKSFNVYIVVIADDWYTLIPFNRLFSAVRSWVAFPLLNSQAHLQILSKVSPLYISLLTYTAHPLVLSDCQSTPRQYPQCVTDVFPCVHVPISNFQILTASIIHLASVFAQS
jgi:hypothetical protein